jgi:hypothetical protein
MHLYTTATSLLLLGGASAAALHVNLYRDFECRNLISSQKIGNLGTCHNSEELFLSASTSQVDSWFFGKNIKLLVQQSICGKPSDNFMDFDLTNRPNCRQFGGGRSFALMGRGTQIPPTV